MRDIERTALQEFVRSAVDFGFIMGIIWLLSLAVTVHHGHMFYALSSSTAAIAAVDLAFWRHLRRVYAYPRRDPWRRE